MVEGPGFDNDVIRSGGPNLPMRRQLSSGADTQAHRSWAAMGTTADITIGPGSPTPFPLDPNHNIFLSAAVKLRE
jgi:hypothetical protein